MKEEKFFPWSKVGYDVEVKNGVFVVDGVKYHLSAWGCAGIYGIKID